MTKSNIYTKTGDDGKTSLVGGVRIPKTSVRIEAYGTTDELNSFIGLLATEMEEEADKSFLLFLQNMLFNIGSYLATDPTQTEYKIESRVTTGCVRHIEEEIDRIDSSLPKIHSFLLPGGCRSAALAHVCRTVCRRAERCTLRLKEQAEIEPEVLKFINRMSDYFFVLARKECVRKNGNEIIWDSTCIY